MGVDWIVGGVGLTVTTGKDVGVSEWADIGVAVMEGGEADLEWAPMDAIPA